MKVKKMISKITLSNKFQTFINKTKDKKFSEKINRNLPLYESAFATSCYLVANQTNSSIPKERKASLNYQTAIGGILGIAVSKSLDSWTNNHKNKICNELEKMNIPNSKKILTGARIAVPLIITTFTTRYLASYFSIPISTFLAHIQRKYKKGDK